ncbi:MAG: DegT/DnrJ/EryC1/StrS family aminotransferase, partial [Armatimonadota bacterium]|nr:DegT/DnrJ/EryC1/StrS family aminotransferase [Armatimonadota bacterium]
MSIEMANLRVQYAEIKDEVDSAVRGVIENGDFRPGESVIRLENDVAAMCGAKFGVAVHSGTDAILIALRAAGVRPGDEVVTTPFTFVATTEAIVLAGAVPVYADIDPDTFNIDPEDIERRITSKTTAILPVHLYGQCAEMDAIESIASRHGLKVIYDAAQAIGAAQNSRRIGETGNAATLSFFPTKNLGAYGDAGMILTNDEALCEKARLLRVHGMKPGSYYYEDVGYCSRLDELQAAVLLVKLKRLETWNEKRRQNAARYFEALSGTPIKAPTVREGRLHTFHQFTICHPRRDDLHDALWANGIGSAVYYPLSLHLQPAYRYLGYAEGDFPIAEKAAKEVLSIPVHPELTEDQA